MSQPPQQPPTAKVYLSISTENLHEKKETIYSAEAITPTEAWDLFMKLRKEAKA